MDFAGYKYIATLLAFTEIAIVLLYYRRDPKLAFYAILVSIALKGQYLWVGRPIFAWQIAGLLGLVFMFGRSSAAAALRPGRTLSGINVAFQLYCIYALAISVPLWAMFSAEGLGNSATAVSSTRIVTQVVYFSFIVGLFGFGRYAGRYVTTFDLLRTLVIVATIVAAFALVQVVVFSRTGLNLFPIIGSDDTIRSAYINNQTFRATSFAGEPKHLGILMSVGLTSFFLARLFRIRIAGRMAALMPLTMIVAVVLSLSTTGIALSVAGIGISSILFFRRFRFIDAAALSIVLVAFLGWYLNADTSFQVAMEQQLTKEGLEPQDDSVRLALLANPEFILTGTGLGNIHLIAADYLPANFPLFRDVGYKPNSGFLFVLGDTGLIGLALLAAMLVFGLQGYLKERKLYSIDARREATVSLAVLFLTFISLMLRYDVLFFLLSGFVYTRLSILRTRAIEAQGAGTQTLSLRPAEYRLQPFKKPLI